MYVTTGYNTLIWKKASNPEGTSGSQVASALSRLKEQRRQRRSRMGGREKRPRTESGKGVWKGIWEGMWEKDGIG